MANKIGIILAVDGEKEFRDAMSNASNAAKQVKAELQALEGVYSGNANSLEALTKKQELLEKQQGRVKAALEQAKAGYDNAQKAVEKHRAALDNSNREVDEAQKELERLKSTYGEASDAVKEQESRLAELTRTQEENQRNLSAAEKGAEQWAKKVSSAAKDVQKNNKALEENERYLDEARNATDKCATSIDKYGNKAKKAADETEELNTGWKSAFKNAAANAALNIATGLLSKFADKAKEAALYAIEVGSAFDAAMSEVSALSGATGTELEALSTKAQKLGATTKFSAAEAAQAFQYMSLAGWDAQTSLSAIDGVMQLAAASGMELAQASDMITDYLSAFSMEASEATRVADMLAYAQSHSNTTAEQLGEAYGNCAAGLNTAGQSIETVTAMLEAMANQGRKGSEAGTALNSIMSQITQKMKDGAIEIGETTVAVQDQSGNFRDLMDIVSDVEAATKGMGTAERSAALAAVFNRTALSGLNLVLNEGVDKIRGYRDELYRADGAAAAMASTMQDNLKGDITTMNSALEGLGIAAYNYIDGPLRAIVQGVTGVISGITGAITPQKTVLDSFIEDVKQSNKQVQATLDTAKGALEGYEADAAKLEVYKETLMGVAGATDLTEFQKYQVSKIVKELADDVPELSAAWDEEAGVLRITAGEVERLMNAYTKSAKMEAYTKAMKSAADALIDSEINVAKAQSAYTAAQEEFDRVAADAMPVYNGFTTTMGKAYDAAYAAEEQARNALKEATKQQEEAQAEYGLTAQALEELGATFDENGNLIAESMAGAAEATSEFGEAARELTTEELERIEKAAESMHQGISDSMQGAISVFHDFETQSADDLDTIIHRLEQQKEAVDGWASNMETLASQIGQGMTQEFYDYLAQLGPQQGAALVQELVDSMAAGDGKFEEVAKTWTEAMDVSADADKLAEATTAGKNLAAANAAGMKEGEPEVKAAAENMTQAGITAVLAKRGEYQAAGKDSATATGEGITSGTDGITTAGSNATYAGIAAINAQRGGYYFAGQNLASGTGDGISSMGGYVSSAAREIVQDALAAAKSEAGIHSPSRKWKQEVGEMLTKGMTEGIKAGKKDAQNAAREISDAVYDKATAWIAKKKKKQDVSAKDEADFWKKVEKAAKDGVEKYNKQVAKAAEAAKKVDKAENAALAARISSRFGVSKTTTTGSGSNKKTVQKDTETYYSEIFSAAKKYLDNYEALHDISLAQEKTYWTKLQKTLKKGTQAWYDAQKQINSVNDQIKKAKASLQSETLAADEAYVKKRTYQGKMDAETELAYWKKQLKGFKSYTDEWYAIKDKIASLQTEIDAAAATAQAGTLDKQEAYVKKRIYQGKMDTAAELEYWEKKISGYKKYSDEWYSITDRITALREQAAEDEARARSEMLNGWEAEVDRKRTLEDKDAEWELAYWQERIGRLDTETDEYLSVYKKIKSLQEEIASSAVDPAEEARQQRQTLSTVQNSILSRYKTYYKVSLKAEAQYWDAARKQFTEGTDERIDADQKYFDAVQAYTDQREQLEKDYLEEQQSIMDEEKANIEELTKAYTDAVSQREDAILKSFGLFDAWDNEGYTSEAMLRNARTQIEGLKLWEQEITALREKNLPAGLLEQLEEMGPEATANIYTLNRMTAGELDEWVRIWQDKQDIAKRQAENQSKGILSDTAQGIAEARSEAEKKLNDLRKQYESDLAEINEGISGSLSGLVGKAQSIGEDTVSSLIAGIKTELSESLPGMEAYYSDWESRWMGGMNRLNAATAYAGTAGNQTVTVDTGNIAGILAAILTTLTDVRDGVGSGATITMDDLTARISTNMAAASYRSARGGVL